MIGDLTRVFGRPMIELGGSDMKSSGFALVGLVVGMLLLTAFGGGGYVVFRNLTGAEKPKESPLVDQRSSTTQLAESSPSPISEPVSQIELSQSPQLKAGQPSPTLDPTAMGGGPITYKQPQGKYTIILPGGWVENLTAATSTYSTTKFTGTNGYVAITFGSGKDPIGGCSETSSVILADRTINGCFLLQKDGSQLLTRTYTKDKAGIDFTIEAHINPSLSDNKSVVLDVIKSIDIE